MNDVDAKKLLADIKKTAGFSGIAGLLPNFPTSLGPQSAGILDSYNDKLQQDARSTVLKAILIAGGLGAATRAYAGSDQILNGPNKKVQKPNRVVDMPVYYPGPEKTAFRDIFNGDPHTSTATIPMGLDYFAPGMLLGAPLAAYGGWKGVDALMNRKRKKKMEEELSKAKDDYENALLGSYKSAALESLDSSFDGYTKMAFDGDQSILTSILDTISPNLYGGAKGLGAAYTLAMAPLGYHIVNKVMKKNSKRMLLQKAVQERARRQAKQQPAVIYATPSSLDEPEIN